MGKVIRWGILGCGRIAKKFAADLKRVNDSELIAVGSRNIETANAFADEFSVKYRHDSYEALAQNKDVDVIYIATPHNLHYENTILCLNNNKAVLCEKPFAMNYTQSKAMVDLARERKVFLMEAVWSKFLPHYILTKQLIADGKIGNVRSMLVNFGFKPLPPVPDRLFNPELGGGTIMDIGIYNAFFALSFLGEPDEIEATMTPASTGVDEQCAVLFKYKNGAVAQLFSTFTTDLATEADICGDKGRIRLGTRFYEPSTTIEYYTDRKDSRIDIPFEKEEGFGYQHEARHVVECLQKNLTESPVMSQQDTLTLISVLDKIRSIAGIKYREDINA